MGEITESDSPPVPTVLTFDDGPVAVAVGGQTRAVGTCLAKHGIAGAFFVQTGVVHRMGSPAGRAVVLDLLGQGHVVGIHTGTRPQAPGLPLDGKKRPEADHRPYPERFLAPPYDVTGDDVPDGSTGLESDLMDAKERLSTLAGAPPKYVRATYGDLGAGEIRAGILGIFADLGLLHVLWNIDSGDSSRGSTVSLVRRELRKQARRLVSRKVPAIVALFHDIKSNTASNIETYIEDLEGGAREGGGALHFTTNAAEIDSVFQRLYGA